jgi:hypothetical protein
MGVAEAMGSSGLKARGCGLGWRAVGQPGSECCCLQGVVGYLKGSVTEADRPESEVDMGVLGRWGSW